jgi:hypothetical protein
VPLKLTTEPAMKPLPVTVRVMGPLPATAEAGVRLAIAGMGLGALTVKDVLLVAVPLGVVTAIRPDVAPTGTTNDKVAALTTVKLLTSKPFSVRTVAPSKLVPTTVTVVPTGPLAGVKLVMVGAGTVTARGSSAVVPPPGAGLVTVMP